MLQINPNKTKDKKVRLGLPRGLLKEQTQKLFKMAGYSLELKEEFYRGEIDDPDLDIFLALDQELTIYTQKGALDAAIAQVVYLIDQEMDLPRIASFKYGVGIWENAKIVLAVPKDSSIKTVKDLQGKKILSRLPNLTKKYLEKHGVRAEIEWTDRPGEPKVPLLADALVEFTNTGRTLEVFNLKIIDILTTTAPTLFMSKQAYEDDWKRRKIEDLALLLEGARRANDMVGLTLHAENGMMEEVLTLLPALKKPTVTQLRGEDWFEVFSVVEKKEARTLIPKLKEIGCRDIVEFPLEKVIL